MAVTKIWPVTTRLDNAIKYIENEDKTIEDTINYISRDSTTANQKYVTCINCSSNNPYQSMMNLKDQFCDDHKRIAYHAMQAFAPGEGTPEMIHEIGIKLAKELFGDKYQVVIATHLDKDHLHNHFIINTTSIVDGKHYCNTRNDINRLREASDRLCKEYHLSIIESPTGRGKSKNQANYLNSYIKEIKKDIDYLKLHSFTFTEFKEQMLLEGYEFIKQNNKDYIIHPKLDQPIPLSRIGKKYSLDYIYNTIANNDDPYSKRSYYKLIYPDELVMKYRKHELRGLQYLYVKWQIDLGILQVKPHIKKQYLSKEIKQDLRKLDLISHSTELLVIHNITNINELNNKRSELQARLDNLLYKRRGAYYQRKLHPDNQYWNNLINEYTREIKELRLDIRALDDVEKRSERLERQQQIIEEQNQKKGITRY